MTSFRAEKYIFLGFLKVLLELFIGFLSKVFSLIIDLKLKKSGPKLALLGGSF